MPIPLDERLQRMAAWLRRENDRPLIGFTLGSYYPLRRYPQAAARLPEGPVTPADICVEDYLADTEHLYSLHEAAGGDMLFSAAPFLGLPWLEASLGCGVIADHSTGSTRSTPPPGFAACRRVPDFDPSNPWVRKLIEFIPALERQAAGRYPVGVTLMRGISDLLSALYGGDFALRLLDDPDQAADIIDGLTRYWIAFGRHLLAHLPRFHGGTGAFSYCLWLPGEQIWLQEDAVALMSPRLYERFIYPADCRIGEAFEHTVIHLHPTRYIPSRLLAASPISALELHIDHDGPRAAALLDHYQTMLAAKPLFVWGDISDGDLECLLTRLPHRGLAINVVVPDVAAAQRVWTRALELSI